MEQMGISRVGLRKTGTAPGLALLLSEIRSLIAVPAC